MNGILDNYFALDLSTLQAKNKRSELISENIANTSTPGFKARDLDFGEFIENAQNLAFIEQFCVHKHRFLCSTQVLCLINTAVFT